MPPRSEAVLLLTHFLDEHIVSLYRRLAAEAGARDVRILFNATDDGNPGYRAPGDAAVWPFGEADLRSLGYPRKGRHISDLDIELFSFPFQRAHPEYEHVWIVEYDVDFTGSWSEVFDAFSSNDADLLATNIHRFADNPGWWNWRGVRGPGGRVATEALVRVFMPFSRMSRRAYATLDAAYRQGWRGHYECTVPTILTQAALRIEDIGGDGEFVRPANRNRFYTSTPTVNDLSPGTFVFRPVMAAAGGRPNTLWHPVKPPGTRYVRGWRLGRMAAANRRLMALARRAGRQWSWLRGRKRGEGNLESPG
ncbi:MAG: hypothetical protein H3C38_08870 [Rhodospirillales bacterium]|nr:hypothetical protein [Rhodospirillales bacterium]